MRTIKALLIGLLLTQPLLAIRIPSGSTTHKKFFRMVDATDHVTPETGLSSFTVYRSREGGTSTLWTTPTITEIDATNAPGLYAITVDEDTTITTANDTEELAIAVAHAGCDTEIFLVELYDDTGSNRDAQPWNAAWDTEVQSEANDAIVANHLDHLLAATYDVTAQPGSATALLNRIVESDSGNPIFTTQVLQQAPVLSQAGVRTAVGLAAANLDTQLSAIVTDTGELQTSLADGGFTDLLIDAILTDTAEIGAAGAGLTEAGGTGDQLTAVAWNAAWDAEVESEANDALVAIHLDHLLAVDYDPATQPGTATALFNELIESDAGVSRFTINALENGPSGSGASAASIADAVWDELQADHVAAGSFGEMATEAASILADTNELQTDWANGGRLDLILDTAAAGGGASAAAIADAVLDEALSGHTTDGTAGDILFELDAMITGSVYSAGALVNAPTGGAVTISPVTVSPSRTWVIGAEGFISDNTITVNQNFDGTFAMDVSLNPDAVLDITGTHTASITGAATVTADSVNVSADGKQIHVDVPALTTTGTYTVIVTAQTLDSQTIPLEGKLVVR